MPGGVLVHCRGREAAGGGPGLEDQAGGQEDFSITGRIWNRMNSEVPSEA